MPCYRWEGKDLILFTHIQPRASQTAIIGIQGDRLKIKITAAPVDGKANAEVYQLLAKEFGVAKSKISLQHGETSRQKTFRIPSPTQLPDFIAVI